MQMIISFDANAGQPQTIISVVTVHNGTIKISQIQQPIITI